MIVKKLTQGTQEWLDYRKNKIGGSDIASILEVDGAYKTRNAVLKEKLGKAEELTEFQKQIFQDGHDWEEIVRFNLNNSSHIQYTPAVIESEFNSGFFASLDGLASDGLSFLEVKSTSKKDLFDAVENNEIPLIYEMQIQWAFFVSNYELEYCILVVVHNGKTTSQAIYPNLKLIKLFTEAGERFLSELESSAEAKHLSNPKFTELVNLKFVANQMEAQLDVVNERIKELSKELLTTYQATQLEGSGIRLELVDRVGSVNYKLIPELKNVDLDMYRGKSVQYAKVSITKGAKNV